jgi:predicted MFS family arabinose efflux permease
MLTAHNAVHRHVREPNLYRILSWLAADFISMIGDELSTLAIYVLAVYKLGPAEAGLILLASGVARVALTLPGGVIADRANTKKIVMICDGARVIGLATIAGWIAANGVSLLSVGALAMYLAICGAIAVPAEGTLLIFALDPQDIPRFQGMRSVLIQAAGVAGAPIGGFIIAAFGGAAAVTGDCFSFAIVLSVLKFLPRRERRADRSRDMPRPGVFKELRAGISYVLRSPVIWPCVVLIAIMNTLGSSVLAIAVARLTEQQGWGPAGLGVLLGTFGAGGIIGGLIMVALAKRVVHAGRLVSAGFLVASMVFPALAWSPGLAEASFSTWAIGLGAGFAGAWAIPLIQAHTADPMIGRVMSVVAVGTAGAVELSAAAAGFLVAAVGASGALTAAGMAGTVVALASLALPALREASLPHAGTP